MDMDMSRSFSRLSGLLEPGETPLNMVPGSIGADHAGDGSALAHTTRALYVINEDVVRIPIEAIAEVVQAEEDGRVSLIMHGGRPVWVHIYGGSAERDNFVAALKFKTSSKPIFSAQVVRSDGAEARLSASRGIGPDARLSVSVAPSGWEPSWADDRMSWAVSKGEHLCRLLGLGQGPP